MEFKSFLYQVRSSRVKNVPPFLKDRLIILRANITRVSGVAYLWLLKVKNAFETLLNNWLKNLNMAINK